MLINIVLKALLFLEVPNPLKLAGLFYLLFYG
jgi:hypothetical protein